MTEQYEDPPKIKDVNQSLREKVILQQARLVNKRRLSNPAFTPLEANLGRYKEEIEPQVQQAVFSLLEKGYSTYSSGFYDFDPSYQAIEGTFSLDQHTTEQLQHMGVRVMVGYVAFYEEHRDITILQFRPNIVEIAAITQQWNEIVNMIPPRNNS